MKLLFGPMFKLLAKILTIISGQIFQRKVGDQPSLGPDFTVGDVEVNTVRVVAEDPDLGLIIIEAKITELKILGSKK